VEGIIPVDLGAIPLAMRLAILRRRERGIQEQGCESVRMTNGSAELRQGGDW